MTKIDYPQLYIGGTWTAPAGHDTIEVHSATTEDRIGSVPRGSEADIDAAVAAARTAFDASDGWATWDPKERADVLEQFAVELEADMARPEFRGRFSAVAGALLQRPDDQCTR
jgi:aldehyde dehydrogenase (NAD+)